MEAEDYEQYSNESDIQTKPKNEKKGKKKLLGKNSKKVVRLMKRFDEDSSDDNEPKIQEKSKEFNEHVEKSNKKNKKQQEKLKQQKQITQKAIEERETQSKTTIGNVFDEILNQDISKAKQKNPIFAQMQKPLKQIKKEIRQEKENKLRKKIKELKARRGHVKPSALSGEALIQEKELKIITTKGVIKIFEAITNFQKENVE
ncbi:hypothetical protein PPERSA_00566 [Pseudocohnilembus persalinus]|uniref:Rrp15p-domain-containing protein n=1 Tax=Pseudocohnilembus persalinus TaxID=266149 RepID=A0A0V0QSU2_PSEPJ|nr:hypothetical protein PPERSA_00566 [Pseudocohnilembus persalinus]|eukprot:KRX05265.1 hypothetical protein PPERSA_00566 [Pseudocohnilembus persalinus]